MIVAFDRIFCLRICWPAKRREHVEHSELATNTAPGWRVRAEGRSVYSGKRVHVFLKSGSGGRERDVLGLDSLKLQLAFAGFLHSQPTPALIQTCEPFGVCVLLLREITHSAMF